MDKCTRAFYEDSVHIRNVKLEAAERAFGELKAELPKISQSKGKIAVIGGGPAGLSSAFFLSKAGYSVTIFEKRDSLGGIVSHVIPEFRIGTDVIRNDIEFATSLGVELRLNTEVSSFDELGALSEQGFEKFIFAVGAWKPGVLNLDQGHTQNALEFLQKYKADPSSVSLGENVVVIGGGNTAMDTARAAKRVPGVKTVSVVYRRTKRQMPADVEELKLALHDGVVFRELLAPNSLESGILVCSKMQLAAPDESGKRSPVSTGDLVEIPADSVISAIGDSVDDQLYEKLGIKMDDRRRPVLCPETLESSIPGLYIAGDAMRGPATVAEAIADAIRCTEAISGEMMDKYAHLNISPDIESIKKRKGCLISKGACVTESERCLECATICESCVEVCPNRANVVIEAKGHRQVLHIDYMCNECGNCEFFCPYSGAPYKDKFTLFACEEDFKNSKNSGFLPLTDGSMRIRLDDITVHHTDGIWHFDELGELIQAVLNNNYLLFKHEKG
jgi:putative selenate reductase